MTSRSRLALGLRSLLVLAAIAFSTDPAWAEGPRNNHRRHAKLDGALNERNLKSGESDVIVEFTNDKDALKILKKWGRPGRRLGILKGYSARIPNHLLDELAAQGLVKKVSHDREVKTLNGRTAITTGARTVQEVMGYDGSGIGVAVIDSGVTGYHPDLTVESTQVVLNPPPPLGDGLPVTVPFYSGQRVAHFADFTSNATAAYDDYGHGSHVAGIIAGNGAASLGTRKSIAPGASIIALKALNGQGTGTISQIIAAIDYAVANKDLYNIRVMNLSVGAGVYESYNTDPLTLACKRAVDAGIVVVAAAGNLGKAADGSPQYGAISAPANAPWVLTVGGSSTQGTTERTDDVIGLYSSRGPTMIDYRAKPDLVAPGTGTVSLSDPLSHFYLTKPNLLLAGSGGLGAGLPYLSLTGTSMAAPVVAGTVALMLDANPNLTPNLVKAMLQFTAEVHPDYNWLTQGAGFLNAHAAVQLAEFFQSATPGLPYPDMTGWSGHVFWGNRRITGGVITPGGTAWRSDVVWGATATPAGQAVVWGENCGASGCDNVVWGNNVVWGGECEGDACNVNWGATDTDDVVWGTCVDANGDGVCDDDNIVWGNNNGDNIVWADDCEGEDCDNIIWGNSGGDDIVWGNCADADGDGECDNIIWGNCVRDGDDGCDNIIWGNSGEDNIVWGDFLRDIVFGDETPGVVTLDPAVWNGLFKQSGGTPSPGRLGGIFKK